jgi:hypothetical protein
MPEPDQPRNVRGQMLPGIAGICLFMIFMVMINVYATITGAYGRGLSLAIGIFGLLRLTKWGWAIVTAGCLLFASGDFFYFSRLHVGFFLVRALLVLLFFLYLVRQETRERLR